MKQQLIELKDRITQRSAEYLSAIDKVIELLATEPAPASERARAKQSRRRRRSSKVKERGPTKRRSIRNNGPAEQIRQLILSRADEFTIEQIRDLCPKDIKTKLIYDRLHYLKKAGLIQKTGYGLYRLSQKEEPAQAESNSLSGPVLDALEHIGSSYTFAELKETLLARSPRLGRDIQAPGVLSKAHSALRESGEVVIAGKTSDGQTIYRRNKP